jgi:hypothetical protein
MVAGRAGDLVLVGDWGCEGAARPAVLRPSTGEVLVYGPAEDAGALLVARAERVEGAIDLVAHADAEGCAALFAVTDLGAIRLT